MSKLLLHRIIERDCVAGMAALPDGMVDPVFADPPKHLLLGGDLHRPNNGMVDAGDSMVSPDGHLTAHSLRVRRSGAEPAQDDIGTSKSPTRNSMLDNSTLRGAG